MDKQADAYRLGMRIDDSRSPFRLLRCVGARAYTHRFLAEVRATGHRVVLEVLQPSGTRNRSVCEDFARTAERLDSLRHPAIARLRTTGRIGALPYMCFDAGGLRIDRVLVAPSLRSRVAREVGARVAGALAFAHRRGIGHGALSAAQVTVDGRGAIELGGFGVELEHSPDLMAADVAALGEIMRALVGRTPEDPLGRWLVGVAASARSAVRSDRPTARELCVALSALHVGDRRLVTSHLAAQARRGPVGPSQQIRDQRLALRRVIAEA